MVFVLSTTAVYSQTNNVKSTKIETISGKSFYIHTVEKGQTLYGISKIYSISVDEILEHNPDASSGLKKRNGTKNSIEGCCPTLQTIQQLWVILLLSISLNRGETLYSIAKQH